jgi:NADPH:quinone reductase-like Zn-dependent oxidoreductase
MLELAVALGDRVYPPKGCTFNQGATPVAGLTAWQMVMNRASVRPGESCADYRRWQRRQHLRHSTLSHPRRTRDHHGQQHGKSRKPALGAEAGIDYTREDILERVRRLLTARV